MMFAKTMGMSWLPWYMVQTSGSNFTAVFFSILGSRTSTKIAHWDEPLLKEYGDLFAKKKKGFYYKCFGGKNRPFLNDFFEVLFCFLTHVHWEEAIKTYASSYH